MEIWKDVKGFEGKYKISNFGNVKSLKRKRVLEDRILSPGLNSDGYHSVVLFNGVSKVSFKVHSLVAIAFLGHEPNGLERVINHIDFNRTNNHVDNLEIVSMRENAQKRKHKGSSKYSGVCWDKNRGKWLSTIKVNPRHIHLGRFDSEIEAAEAYEKALVKYGVK